jgi:basic membrane protein A and related proteins
MLPAVDTTTEVRSQGRCIWWLCFCIILWMISGSQTGCRRSPKPTTPAQPTVAVAYAIGGKGDLSYNDAAATGAASLRKRGFTVHEFEPPTIDQYRDGIELLARQGAAIVFCVGYLYEDPVLKVAPQFPQTSFVVLDGTAQATNVWSIKFNASEGSELAGFVAGSLTKTGTVAFIGGMDIPIMNEFRDGFTRGAKRARPDTRVLSFYVGSTPAGFTDPVRGKEAGFTAIAQGADVLFPAAGTSGNGVIEAAKEKSVLAIGVDVDQRHLAPGTVVTSMLKNFDHVMEYFVDKYTSGGLQKGQSIVLGYSDGAVGLAPLPPDIDGALKQGLNDLRRDLDSR